MNYLFNPYLACWVTLPATRAATSFMLEGLEEVKRSKKKPINTFHVFFLGEDSPRVILNALDKVYFLPLLEEIGISICFH